MRLDFSILPDLLHLPYPAHILSCPPPSPDSMSSSVILYLSRHPPHTKYFSSPIHHHLSITHVPFLSTDSALYLVPYSTERHCTSNGAFSSLSAQIILSALHSWSECHVHTLAIAFLTVFTYTIPFNINDISFIVKIIDSSLSTLTVKALSPLMLNSLVHLHSAYPPGNRTFQLSLSLDIHHFLDSCFLVCWYPFHHLLSLTYLAHKCITDCT